MNRGYASILIYAKPPMQKSRYVNETCSVDTLFTYSIVLEELIIKIVDLVFKYFPETILIIRGHPVNTQLHYTYRPYYMNI